MKVFTYLLSFSLFILILGFSPTNTTTKESKKPNDVKRDTYIPFYFFKGTLDTGCIWGAGLVIKLDCDDVDHSDFKLKNTVFNYMNDNHPPTAGGNYKKIQLIEGPEFSDRYEAEDWVERRSRKDENKLSCYTYGLTYFKNLGTKHCD